MSNTFGFSDLGRVQWLPTLKLALGRGFAAGLVWAIVIPLTSGTLSATEALMMPFFWAFLAVPIALLLSLVAKAFGAFIPILGACIMLAASLFVCVGDPLIYVINRSFPKVFEIADFRLFNFSPLIYILSPD
ncbi:MAG: hypothetical protein ACK5LJ_13935 [Paracoccus sp. (in: a-proteobacteria)]